MELQALFNISTGCFLRYTSPWAFCILILWESEGVSGQIPYGLTGRWPGITQLCELTAIFVLLTLTALALYRRRRSEVSGAALAFHRLEGEIKILLAVLAALIFFPIRYDVFGYNTYLPAKEETAGMAVESSESRFTYPEAVQQKKSAKNKSTSQNFTNAVRVLGEIAQEDNAEDFSVVYG